MCIEDWANIASILQSIVTAGALVVGGIWTYLKFIRQQEKYPNIEFLADINLIGKQDDHWIAEIIATIENKGKAQHKMSNFEFDLNALFSNDKVELTEKWGNQVNFPHRIAEGSFIPPDLDFFFIDPGTKAKYSHITRVPNDVTFAILHCWFTYSDERSYSHTAEKTLKIPISKSKQ